MKTIIAGSRDIPQLDIHGIPMPRVEHDWGAKPVAMRMLTEAIKFSPWKVTEVVSGRARGVDQLGEDWACKHSVNIRKFPAKWQQYGKRAGAVRNLEMGEYADCLIAVWNGYSKGTAHMIRVMLDMKKPVVVSSPLGLWVANSPVEILTVDLTL